MTGTMQHADVFKKNYLVHGLPDATIEEIAALAVCDGGLAGEALVSRGDKSSDLFVILDGWSRLSHSLVLGYQ